MGTASTVTILDVGRCLGSGEAPRESSEETSHERTTGVCVTCSGRFDVEEGRVVAHQAAPDDEREVVSADESERGTGTN
jgi:hypothetical protein